MLRRLMCRLGLHWPMMRVERLRFRDIVSGEAVGLYRCACGRHLWMATGEWATFRVEKSSAYNQNRRYSR